jgi:hypothetical protein
VFREKRVRTYKQVTVNAVIIAVVLFLLLYMTVQFSRNFDIHVSTQRTHTVTDRQYAYLTGYIFRDEAVVSVDNGCIIDYLIADGEKVGVGHAWADIYKTELVGDELFDKQRELDALGERIRLIEAGIEGGKVVADLASINTSLQKSYYAYINSVKIGDLPGADKSAETMLSAMVDYSVVTGGEASKNISSRLAARKSELIGSLNVAKRTEISEISFNFFRSTDGYEQIFASSKLDGLSPEGLRALADTAPVAVSGQVIGKQVYTPKWYLALPCDEPTRLEFVEGGIYDVFFSDGADVTLDMTLERICVDEADPSDAYLLFSSYDISLTADLSRTQNVRISLGSCSGYRIPTESLHKVNNQDGVYILVGSIVEFRRVTVIGEGYGYYIVKTVDDASGTDVDTPYLSANDLIITSGNDLYDGKHLD